MLQTFKLLDVDTFNEISLKLAKRNKREIYPIMMAFPLNPKGVRELDKALIEALKGKVYNKETIKEKKVIYYDTNKGRYYQNT